jgi:hypothetical protein
MFILPLIQFFNSSLKPPRTQHGTSRCKQCLPWFCGLMERLLLWVRIGEYVQAGDEVMKITFEGGIEIIT